VRLGIGSKILLIALLLLLATPLAGALVVMANGGSMMTLMPSVMSAPMMGVATLWIELMLVLIVGAIVSITGSAASTGIASAPARSPEAERDQERNKAA
jgi:hypothetical protein